MNLLFRLLIAHLLGDFIFQPKSWVEQRDTHKAKSKFLYFHVIIHFALIWLFAFNINFWKQALIISITHYIIDLVKTYIKKQKALWFFIDQMLHIAVIIVIWNLYQKPDLDYSIIYDEKTLVTILAFVFITKPASIIIKTIISKWAVTSSPITSTANNANNTDALQNAGEYIGIIERFLVVVFVLLNQWAAVGFLVTAKSVFRFGDLTKANDRKLTEYVMIGTLLSLGIAILTGVATGYYISNYLRA